MYNVLVADDESYQRLGMKKKIEELRPGYRIFTSTDGQEALNILLHQDIHIAFIDVKMPHIDGIELVERFHKSNKCTRLIIISAYNEFAYAQKALRMGVFDYILKPIQTETISSLLQRVESDIIEEINQMNERQSLQHQLSYTLPIYNEHLLNNWLTGIHKVPEHVVDQQLNRKKFGVVLLADIVHAENHEPFKPENPDLMNALVMHCGGRFQSESWDALAFKIESNKTRIAVVVAANTLKELENTRLADIAGEMARHLRDRYSCLCAFGIGDPADNIYDQAKYSYRQAETALKYLFYTGYPAVLPYGQVTPKKTSTLDVMYKNSLTLAVREHDIEKVCKVIDAIIAVATTAGYMRPQHFTYTLNLWVLDIFELYRHALKLEEFNHLYNQFNARFLEEETGKTIVEYTEHIILALSNLIVQMKAALENKHDDIIRDCIEYLNGNFDKDISLNEAAERCSLSASYFSVLFKMHTGTTLNQYMLDLRMKRATELLGISNIKIYKIAETLGYRDTKYFHRIFKRYYKMTPQEYKSSLKKRV